MRGVKKENLPKKNVLYVVWNFHGEKNGTKIGMRSNIVANYAETKDK